MLGFSALGEFALGESDSATGYDVQAIFAGVGAVNAGLTLVSRNIQATFAGVGAVNASLTLVSRYIGVEVIGVGAIDVSLTTIRAPVSSHIGVRVSGTGYTRLGRRLMDGWL